MYKVFFDSRPVSISREPDRLQKYGLFYKFESKEGLYCEIRQFINDRSIPSMNVYGNDIEFLWKSFRSFFKVVEAAGGLVRHISGRYLVMKRNGMVDLPKGHVENGESHRDCALREVSEECGINGQTILKKLRESYHYYPLKDKNCLKITHWFLMEYTGDIMGTPQKEEGITELKWLTPTELSGIRTAIWPSLNQLIDFALKEG